MNSEAGFLVPSSYSWRGTVGLGLTAGNVKGYLHGLSLSTWRPSIVVLHNTGAPRLDQWHSDPKTGKVYDPKQRLRNLASYYQGLGWQGGPHAFVADDLVWLFNPLWKRGTHSPSWNSFSWGVEMVGDYATEDFASGPGAKVRDNAVALVAALFGWIGVEPTEKTLRLHKEDPGTTHDCPGKHVSKDDFLSRVKERTMLDAQGDHAAPTS